MWLMDQPILPSDNTVSFNLYTSIPTTCAATNSSPLVIEQVNGLRKPLKSHLFTVLLHSYPRYQTIDFLFQLLLSIESDLTLAMAPKRGGGGISSSGFDGDDDSESSPWTHMTQLYGSNFRNHYLMAQIVIIGICLFALVIIAIWALSFKKQNPPSRALFRWYSFGTAITIALV